MAHSHNHSPLEYGRAFAIGITLNIVYIVVEAAFGFWGNSLALLSDAGHNLSDVIGLLLAWGGFALSRIPPSSARTYGWRGSTILAALFNALLLLAAVGAITWEAIGRLFNPADVPAGSMIAVAAIGVVINAATALLFHGGKNHDLNIRGAYLHMLADAGVSLGVVLAGVAIQFTGWAWLDPSISMVIAAIIFFSTWSLLKESFNLAMQAVPENIDPVSVRDYLASLPDVTGVSDLHIWAMSTTETALTAHIVKPTVENDDNLLCQIKRELHDRYHIEHVTIQIERSALADQCALR